MSQNDSLYDILNEFTESMIDSSNAMLDAIQDQWSGQKIRDISEVTSIDREVVMC